MFLHFTMLVLACSAILCVAARTEDAPLDVQIKNLKKQSALAIKKKIKQAEIGATLGPMYARIGAYLKSKGIQPLAAPPFALYADMSGETFEIAGGMPVPGGTAGEGDIVPLELPGGRAAFAVHTGPYENLHATCDKMQQILKSKGLKGTGVLWEVYVSDPGDTKPEALKTEIYIPIDEKK